jgi:hypothetical protein
MPRTDSGMLGKGNPNSGAESGQIHYNHDKSKQIHSHQKSDCGVHCQNANQPKESSLLHPNEDWVPISIRQIEIPRIGSAYLNWTNMSGERRLNRGRIQDLVIARASVGVAQIDLIEHVIECFPIVHLDIQTA